MHLNTTKHVFWDLNDKVLVTDFKRADRTTNLGIKHSCDNPIPVWLNFDSAKAVLTLIDPDALLPKVQYHATVVNIEQTKDLPYHKAYGFNTHAPNGTSPDVAFATLMATWFLEDMGALHTEAIKRVFQPTKGIKDVGLAYENEGYNLQPLPDALHSRRVGYMPLVDRGNYSQRVVNDRGREWKRKELDALAVCFGKYSHHHQNQQTTYDRTWGRNLQHLYVNWRHRPHTSNQ